MLHELQVFNMAHAYEISVMKQNILKKSIIILWW